MKAAIIGGGIVEDYSLFAEEIQKSDLIICADGGIRHLINVMIPPHVFIGDFDSCSYDEVVGNDIMKNVEIISHNPIKDDTDMQLCIDYALENGCNELCLYAALGGRIDHELSNIYNLKYILEHGADGMIFSSTNRIYITDKYIRVKREEGYKISVISVTPISKGVTLKGLFYPLENAELTMGTSLGISNEFIEEYADIRVDDGILLVVLSKDNLNIKE